MYPTLELDYNKLLDMVSEMGYRLMKSGAEIYRVEESIQRLLQAYGAPRGEVFAIPNCLMVSLTSPDGRPVTQIRRMPTHGTDIYLLEKYNGLCRRLCRETPAFEEALEQMEAITRTHRVYSLPTQLAAHFLGCGMFSLFYGGTPADGLCGGLCGMVIGLCMALMTRLGANLFFRTIAGGAASALAAVALTRLGVGQNQDLIIIGALMALVPGIAMTNAMRDIIYGDTNSGINRIVQVFLIAAALAVGTATAWSLAERLWGAPVSAPAVDHSVLAQCLFACIGCFGFSILFNIHGPGGILCTIGGIACWVVFWLSQRLGFSEILSYFWASLFASLYSEIMARIRKYPAISYLLVSAFPLIPGAGVYYTMNYAVRGEMDMFAYRGMNTAAIAGIMAVGILLGSTVFRMYAQWKSRRMQKTKT